jgi:PAS domain S-box-containing protein
MKGDMKKTAPPTPLGKLERRNAELTVRNQELGRTVGKLRGRERLYRTIADFAFDWEYWVDPAGLLIYVSPSCERITGYPPDAFMSDPELLLRIVHSDDLPSLDKHLHGEIVKEELPPLDFRIHTAHGETRWISHACRAVFDESGVFVGRRAGNRDVTERMAMEEALRRQEQLLHRNMLEHAEELKRTVAERTAELRKFFNAVEHSRASIVITSETGAIEYVNPFFTEQTGFSSEEALGKNPRILKSDHHDPDFYKEMWDVLTSGRTWRGEICNRKKDGSLYWEDAILSPVLDDQRKTVGYVAVKADISEKKQAEEARRESEIRYKAIFQGSPEGILIADNDTMKFLHANRAICELLGYREPEILGLGLADIHPPDALPTVFERFKLMPRREASQIQDLPCLRKDGSLFYADVSMSILTIDGKSCSMGFFRDVTERRAAAKLREDIDLILRHDLKVPLNGVINLPEILLEEPGLSADMRESLGLIRDAGRRMLDMINNSLDLYRMESGAYAYQPRPMDLRRTIAGLHSDLAPLAAGKGANIGFRCNGRDCALCSPVMIMGEEMLIYSMLSNLLLNALEATPEGGTATLSAEADGDGKNLVIAIHNQSAIPLEIRDRFFEKYATYGKIKGTGLGVYSARLMARTMGGDIKMETSEESGTTVTATIPLPHEA